MPLYEFRCPEDHVTEAVYKVAERPPAIPCHCGKDAALSLANSTMGCARAREKQIAYVR